MIFTILIVSIKEKNGEALNTCIFTPSEAWLYLHCLFFKKEKRNL
jgi:hypothetical protein